MTLESKFSKELDAELLHESNVLSSRDSLTKDLAEEGCDISFNDIIDSMSGNAPMIL